MTPDALVEFGYQVKNARIREKLTLESLALTALDNGSRKGYLSQVEQGKRPLSAMTIGRLAVALKLPESVTAPLLRSNLPAVDVLDPTDRAVERLIALTSQDKTVPGTADALMIALAYEFAQGSHIELATAYTALRGALQAAQEMKDQLARLHNMDAQLAAVLQKVLDLNNLGLRDAAGDALDAAIKAKEAEIGALQAAALQQDRLRNDAESYAKRLIARLRASAPPGGVFHATEDLVNEWRERGERIGDPFDLAVALELARLNHARAQGGPVVQALASLGTCHSSLGERQSVSNHLTRAIHCYTDALKLTPRKQQPKNWATTQNNLGIALTTLGEREGDSVRLRDAITAYTAALTVRTTKAAAVDWAATQNNLGVALGALGEREGDCVRLRDAITAYTAALTVRTAKATPMDWAATQNNLGNALQALGEREGDSVRLHAAITAYTAALTVWTPKAAPMDWAATQHNLGIAYLSLDELDRAADWVDKADSAFSNALTVHTRETSEYLWAGSFGGQGRVSLARFRLTGDRAELDRARSCLTEARAVFALDPLNITLQDFDRLLAQIDAL